MNNQQRRELEALADRLAAKVHPAHVDYISKQAASEWITALLAKETEQERRVAALPDVPSWERGRKDHTCKAKPGSFGTCGRCGDEVKP